MTTLSASPPQSEPDPRTQNPSSPSQHPQSPQTLTLENPQLPDQTPNPQSEQEEEDPEQDHQDPDPQSANPTLSPLTSPAPSRRSHKRKKGALNKKKQQAIEKKVQTLTKTLNPIPFVPAKTLDFDRHEELLKRLGLWDFVHIKFDQKVRIGLIAQLIANYEVKLRSSYVNGYRIQLNRPALGRALSLPVRREKGGSGAQEAVVLDVDEYDGEITGFLEDILSNWVLLHGEMWLMPNDVMGWTREIKDGHPEKVDWAGLVWFMVEKELSQGVKLEDCYYASHLQHLIKSQREDVFDEEEPEVEVREEEVREEDKVVEVDEERELVEEPNVELTLGEENVEREEAKVEEMVEIEESKDDVARDDWVSGGKNMENAHFLRGCSIKVDLVVDAEEESKDDVAQGDWVMDGGNSKNAEFLEGFDVKEDIVMDAEEEREFEEEGEREFDEEGERLMLEEEDLGEDEEEDDEDFNNTPKIHGFRSDGYQGIDTDISYGGLGAQFDDHSNLGMISPIMAEPISSPGVPFLRLKREIIHDHDFDGGNKRMRMEGSSSKSSEFDFYTDQIQLCLGKSRDMYEAKEKEVEQLSKNQQILMNELQQRDNIIEHLHKLKYEELGKKDEEIYKLDRELFVMGNLIKGYRDALKATQKDFSEYRKKCKLAEEPIYKDVGPGGLVLSKMEIERLRLKREEEERVNKDIAEQMVKKFEEEFLAIFEGYFNGVQMMATKLVDLEKGASEMKEVFAKKKVSESVDCAAPVE